MSLHESKVTLNVVLCLAEVLVTAVMIATTSQAQVRVILVRHRTHCIALANQK